MASVREKVDECRFFLGLAQERNGGGDHVKFGAHVRLVDEETEKEATYQIVGVHEADIKIGRLSVSSPLAKALIGKTIGDTVSVPAPGGDRSYEILGVKFI